MFINKFQKQLSLIKERSCMTYLSTKGILSCISLIRIMKPLGSVGPPLQIKTPQAKCRSKPHSQKSNVFLHNSYRWTSQEAHKKSSVTPQIAEFPECWGPDQLLTQDNITAMPTVKWMPASCKKETVFYFVSLTMQIALTTVWTTFCLNYRILYPERISGYKPIPYIESL